MSDQTSAMLKFKVPSFGFSKLKISSPKPYVPPAPQEPGSYPDRPVTVAVIGAGTRGKSLAHYATVFPEWMTIVAVAEPNEIRRVKFSQEYSISEENVVTDWKELASRSKFCDAVFIATLDHLHCEPAIAFAELKYHILLEKPMANSIEECRAIVEAVERNNIIFALGHSIRFALFNRRIKSIIDSRILGDILHVDHLNPIGFYHFAHSYVRGNWRNEKESSFLLMTKSCHDLDLINLWMGSTCTQISSFGSLSHFKSSRKPAEAGDAKRCLSCAHAPKCPYDAKTIYLDSVTPYGGRGWPTNVITDIVDIENVTKALETGPYGRCVYESDNDVVDHQVVNMQFENGTTVAFSLVATTVALDVRKTTFYGSLGQIECNMGTGEIVHVEYLTRKRETINTYKEAKGWESMSGHGGGDFGLVRAFLTGIWKSWPKPSRSDEAVSSTDDNDKQADVVTEPQAGEAVPGKEQADDDRGPEAWKRYLPTPRETLLSHIYVFAAEKARKENRVIDVVKEFALVDNV